MWAGQADVSERCERVMRCSLAYQSSQEHLAQHHSAIVHEPSELYFSHLNLEH